MATMTIELGNNDSIAITKNGVVVGYVNVKRVRENNVELVGHAVNTHDYSAPMDTWTSNSFGAGMSFQATADQMASAEKFIAGLDA